eukprot:evm.model.scf_677.5 EVM.evm.TU.scf_677.5   scf_677:55350-65577(+)
MSDSKYFTTTKRGEIKELREELRNLEKHKKKDAVKKDDDPYVRKTAAIAVAKLHDINPELVEDRGFLDQLRDMLQDSNPMVVANAVAALAEIQELSGKEVLQVTDSTVFKLLAALNECTEWGQVFILDSMASYVSKDAQQAENIVQRVLPRLQHANGAVVLSAIKVILRQMSSVTDESLLKLWHKKMAPPLVTLLSTEPEVQYVALRNISLIVQKRPEVLTNDVKVFFCKYNDPIYVKLEKLEIMIKLVTPDNIDQVLLEFKEYAQEVDVDFVRKAVRAIGRCAISLQEASERCIKVLLELIQTKVNYVVQEAIIVIKDIFRRYPNKYESIIATLCENLDSLDEPEAKASMVWIIGEYAERIDNADELLETFLETFPEESAMVQLQLLTSTVKLFLKKPTESAQKMISLVLSAATSEVDNPDIRDRAFVYWRLLSTDPEAAKDIVLAEKPVISNDTGSLEPLLLEELLAQMSTLASVYHKPAGTFISKTRLAVQKADEMESTHFEDELTTAPEGQERTRELPTTASAGAPIPTAAPQADLLGDLLDMGGPAPPPAAPTAAPTAAAPAPSPVDDVMDLLSGLDMGAPPAAAAPAAAVPVDPFGSFGAAAPTAAVSQPQSVTLPVVLTPDRGQGLTIGGQLARQGGQMVYLMQFGNAAGVSIDGFMVQFNTNSFGLQPANQVVNVASVAPGTVAAASVPLAHVPAKIAPGQAANTLQIAVKTSQLGVLYISDSVELEALFIEGGEIPQNVFLDSWRTLAGENERSETLQVAITDVDATLAKLKAANVFCMAHRQVPGMNQEAMYLTCQVEGLAAQLLLELRFSRGAKGVSCACKSERPDLAPLLFVAMQHLLS